MELALIALTWVITIVILLLGLLGGVHLSAKTDLTQSRAQHMRAETKHLEGR
ncbi:MAG: hypothetical protein RR853_08825 [Aurantimicrobium sp.]|uniref:hypothetical protein n=1 Tax=Aurantimicrobium sp. TaxID=1930784 RepID=UPI002FC5AC7C